MWPRGLLLASGFHCRFEAADFRKSAMVFGRALIEKMEARCTTPNGFDLTDVPGPHGVFEKNRLRWEYSKVTGFEWYDVGQQHILTDILWKDCAGDNVDVVWRLLTHSNQHVPENMQISSNIRYDPVPQDSKLIELGMGSLDTHSARLQNWLDADGSTTNSKRPTLLGSAVGTSEWWHLGPACRKNTAWHMWACDASPRAQAGSIVVTHDKALADAVGTDVCDNEHEADMSKREPCPTIGWARHFGSTGGALPITPNGKITGPLGGRGWRVSFDKGAPKVATVHSVQVPSDTSLVIALPYPKGTQFGVSAVPNSWCAKTVLCTTHFRAVDSVAKVRGGAGDVYHFDGTHLYLRIVQLSQARTLLPVSCCLQDRQNETERGPFSWFREPGYTYRGPAHVGLLRVARAGGQTKA